VDRGHSARATGFYKHYLPFSYLLTVVALLAWGLAVTLRGRVRWVFAAICAVVTICLAATVTRSAIVFVVLGASVVVWRVGGWKLRAVFCGAAIFVLVLGSIWVQRQRGLGWVSAADAGTQYRLAIWRDGLRLIGKHPLVGVGFDSVFRHPEHWNIEAYRRFPLIAHFHSTLMEYAVDGGLLTVAAWLWLLVAYFRLLLRKLRDGLHDPWLHGTALGIFGGLVALVGISLVQYIGADPAIMTLFWMTMGLGMAVERIGG
jgi:O-antigen ligase